MSIKYVSFIGLVCGVLALTACDGGDKDDKKQSLEPTNEQVLSITASGSSFIYPAMTRWAEQYHEDHAVQVNYQSTGSGAGIRQVIDRLVDFAATDKPLETQELQQQKLLQFPLVLGGVVTVVNLSDMHNGALTLNGPTLANIFSGKITQWNDPAIQALNPQLTLPDQAITVVHRADGSGTTFNFTEYLSKVDVDWQQNIGADSSVKWPVGVGAKGNAGVATYVQRMEGSIGYVEYAYALQNGLAWTKLTNHDGNVVEPNMQTFQQAMQNIDWTAHADFNVSLTNQPGENAWPLTATVFILVPTNPQDGHKHQAIFDFFSWVYTDGVSVAEELDYVPLPDNVVEKVKESWGA